MAMQRLVVYFNAIVSCVLVVGLLAAGLLSSGSVKIVEVPKSYAWSSRESQATDAFADDGAQVSSDALDAEDESGPHPVVQQAQRLVKMRRADEAVSLLRDALRREPGAPGIHNALGTSLLKLERTQQALASFDAAIEIRADEPRYHYNRGTALLRLASYPEAIRSYEQSLALNEFHAQSRYNLALAYSRSDDALSAEREYRALLETDRGETGIRARFNLGVLLMQAGRIDEALEAFIELLRRQPGHIEARFNRALMLARIGSQDEASEQYRRLLDLHPEHLRARLNLAALYMKVDDCDSAVIQLNKLVRRAPSYALAHYNLGVCEIRRDRPVESIPHFLKATSIDPALGQAHYNLALALSRSGDMAGALERYAAAVAATPGVSNFHYNYALALTQADRLGDAIKQYQAALRIEPGYDEALYNLGLAHFRVEDFEAARHVFASALARRPSSYESAYNLGLTLLKLDRASEAERVLRRAIGLEAAPAAHYNLGLSLTRQGRYEEANREYEAVLRIDPKHARSIERLAEGQLELGEHDLALSRLEQLGRIHPEDPTALNAGIRLLKRKQYELAERYLALAVSFRETISARYNLGTSLTRQGRHADAVEHFTAALRIEPDHARAAERLAEAEIALGNHEAALAAMETVSRLAPEDPTGLNAGIRLLRAKEYALALRYFEVAASGGPRLRARSLELIGHALMRLDPVAAVTRLREASREFPDNAGIADQLRRAEAKLGKTRRTS